MYLRRLDTSSAEYNPYALEVVPHAALAGGDFITLSARGLTHYVDGASVSFTSEWHTGPAPRSTYYPAAIGHKL